MAEVTFRIENRECTGCDTAITVEERMCVGEVFRVCNGGTGAHLLGHGHALVS